MSSKNQFKFSKQYSNKSTEIRKIFIKDVSIEIEKRKDYFIFNGDEFESLTILCEYLERWYLPNKSESQVEMSKEILSDIDNFFNSSKPNKVEIRDKEEKPILEGKNMSDEVLAEYPELQETSKLPSTKVEIRDKEEKPILDDKDKLEELISNLANKMATLEIKETIDYYGSKEKVEEARNMSLDKIKDIDYKSYYNGFNRTAQEIINGDYDKYIPKLRSHNTGSKKIYAFITGDILPNSDKEVEGYFRIKHPAYYTKIEQSEKEERQLQESKKLIKENEAFGDNNELKIFVKSLPMTQQTTATKTLLGRINFDNLTLPFHKHLEQLYLKGFNFAVDILGNKSIHSNSSSYQKMPIVALAYIEHLGGEYLKLTYDSTEKDIKKVILEYNQEKINTIISYLQSEYNKAEDKYDSTMHPSQVVKDKLFKNKEVRKLWIKLHKESRKEIVKQALLEGENISDEVLAEYPELQETSKPPSIKVEIRDKEATQPIKDTSNTSSIIALTANQEKFVKSIQRQIQNCKTKNKTARNKEGLSLGFASEREVKEYTELAIIDKARKMLKRHRSIGSSKFMSSVDTVLPELVKIYDCQPTISDRDSVSVKNQQYSTSIPIAFLAGWFTQKGDKKAEVLEPSAGNGLLTVAYHANEVTVNELDDIRVKTLSHQGYKKISSFDAAEPLPKEYIKKFDAVLTNPPFNKIDAIKFNGFKITALDHIMVAYALEGMKDDGRAALIVGGTDRLDDNGFGQGKERFFINYLHSFYNVVSWINIDGSQLYRKQGTSFNIRLILIAGRKPEAERGKYSKPISNNVLIDDFYSLLNIVKDAKERAENKTFLQFGMDANTRPINDLGDLDSSESGDKKRAESNNVLGGQNVSPNSRGNSEGDKHTHDIQGVSRGDSKSQPKPKGVLDSNDGFRPSNSSNNESKGEDKQPREELRTTNGGTSEASLLQLRPDTDSNANDRARISQLQKIKIAEAELSLIELEIELL